jgi:glycosyltransferase involved in cell wall biosynthesis
MPQIGLCMVVKNESAIIERCLRSVRRLVDYVMIEDTGSTDGTQDIIRSYLAAEGLRGEVFEEPWHDFATNRTLALERLRKRRYVDYALIMDADDVAVLADDFGPERFRAELKADFCNVEVAHGGIRHRRPHLLSDHKPFCYRGVLHEYVEAPPGSTSSTTNAFHIVAGVEGDRSRDPNKYRNDALETERDPFLISRYTFYMAQSWRDVGEPELALEAYLRRVELGFWDEEIFVGLLSAARLTAR